MRGSLHCPGGAEEAWHRGAEAVVNIPTPKGSRIVATGGAKRNPWNARLITLPRRGRGGFEPGMLPLPRWGKTKIPLVPRVPLRFTRGYIPWPSGPKKYLKRLAC